MTNVINLNLDLVLYQGHDPIGKALDRPECRGTFGEWLIANQDSLTIAEMLKIYRELETLHRTKLGGGAEAPWTLMTAKLAWALRHPAQLPCVEPTPAPAATTVPQGWDVIEGGPVG